MVILTVLVVLSMVLGLDMWLGAFAGVLWKIAIARAPEHDRQVIETKIDAIAFGFLVSIFFIDTRNGLRPARAHGQPGDPRNGPTVPALPAIIRGLPSLLAAPPNSTPAGKRAVILRQHRHGASAISTRHQEFP